MAEFAGFAWLIAIIVITILVCRKVREFKDGSKLMGWFKSETEPEESMPAPVRLASAEFVSALIEVAVTYELREKGARALIISKAEYLSRKTHINFGDAGLALDEIRDALRDAFNYMAAAREMRDWIRQYEYQGRRPPYLPPLPPPQDIKPGAGGE